MRKPKQKTRSKKKKKKARIVRNDDRDFLDPFKERNLLGAVHYDELEKESGEWRRKEEERRLQELA